MPWSPAHQIGQKCDASGGKALRHSRGLHPAEAVPWGEMATMWLIYFWIIPSIIMDYL